MSATNLKLTLLVEALNKMGGAANGKVLDFRA
jgi:hypothetical protein